MKCKQYKFKPQYKQITTLQPIKIKMRKSSQTNRSALLMAGQNSLQKIDPQGKNYFTTMEYQNRNNNDRQGNEALYQSNVYQVYKRPGYNNEEMPYRPQNKQSKNVNFRAVTQNTQKANTNISRRDYEKPNVTVTGIPSNKQYNNPKTISHLQLQSYSHLHDNNNIKNSPYNKQHPTRPHYGLYTPDQQRIKKIMMKLTYTRLRKMQALVRGFLVRRTVYPRLLQEYLIAKSVLGLIEANVVYREISTVIMETITFPKYEDQEGMVEMYKGRQKVIEDLVYESIIMRVIHKQLKPIIQQSLTQRGLLLNRPQITFGFNLRDPLQLLLYEKLLTIINTQLKTTCQESIRDEAMDRRQLFVIDQWIEKRDMLRGLYEEIASELLEENVGEYVVEDLVEKLVREGAWVVAENVYSEEVNNWYMKVVEGIKENVEEAVFEEAFAEALVQMGFGVEKKDEEYVPL